MAGLYETDTYAWAAEQARRLRAGEPVDTLNIAEEIEDLGKRQRSFLVHNLEILIMHLLKWRYQPANRSKSWTYSILEHRDRVATHLNENPSLRPALPALIEEAYRRGRLKAARQTGMDLECFPETCPYDWNDLLSTPCQAE